MKEEMRKTINLIIDCDPGNGVPGANVDDAIAIAYALRCRKLKTRAIWTVFGNTTSDVGYQSAAALLLSMGREDVPVRRGANGPMQGQREQWIRKREKAAASPEAPAAWKSSDGAKFMHTVPGVAAPIMAPAVTGPDQLARDVLDCDGPVSIAAIGPLTNIATLIKEEPRSLDHIEGISIMGGALGFGDEVDTNFAVDPKAARMVFDSGIPLTLIPLDVTRTTHLSQGCWDRTIAQADPGKAPWRDSMDDWLRPWLTYSGRTRPVNGMWLHDLVAIMTLANRDLVSIRSERVSLAPNGKLMLKTQKHQSSASDFGSYTVRLCTGVDNARMIQAWQEAVLPR